MRACCSPACGRRSTAFPTPASGLAVCTNKPERLARLLLDKLDVADPFAAICGRGTFPMHKPDPRTLMLTIEAAGGDPRRALMVGDSKTDIDTARNAGAPVVAVDFGYTDTPVRGAWRPDRVISHFDELWEAATAVLGAPPSPALDGRPRPLLQECGSRRRDGRLAQRESTPFTREGSQVQSLCRPPLKSESYQEKGRNSRRDCAICRAVAGLPSAARSFLIAAGEHTVSFIGWLCSQRG